MEQVEASELVTGAQLNPDSVIQVAPQPSPPVRLPSSQVTRSVFVWRY